jgi:hypothetical protein
LRVASTTEIKHWVLGWGAACEVLAPDAFRREIQTEIAAMNGIYTPRTKPQQSLQQTALRNRADVAAPRHPNNERIAG